MSEAVIRARIDANVFNYYRIPQGAQIRRLPAMALLTPRRLDLMARYLFVKHRHEGWGIGWATGLYREMLECWNPAFIDGDGRKRGFGDYLAQYGALADAMAKDGYDFEKGLIPVAGGTAVDGAHRLGAALYFGHEVETVELGGEAQIYDAANLRRVGMGEASVEQLAGAYVKLQPDCYMAIFFPEALPKLELLLAVAGGLAEPVYHRPLELVPQARRNLVKLLYGHEPWWEDGKTDDFVKLRFPKGGDAHVLFVQMPEGQGSRGLKEQLRALLPAEHCMHMNDTHPETGWMADALLNANGRRLLSLMPDAMPERYGALLSRYRVLLEGQAYPERFCLDAGGAMAAHGLRDCNDLDYIAAFRGEHLPEDDDIGPHDEQYRSFSLSPDEIVANPAHHADWKGVKVMGLDTLLMFKHWRGEAKDRRDCRLILDARPKLALNVLLRQRMAQLEPLFAHATIWLGKATWYWNLRDRWPTMGAGWLKAHTPMPLYRAARIIWRAGLALLGRRPQRRSVRLLAGSYPWPWERQTPEHDGVFGNVHFLFGPGAEPTDWTVVYDELPEGFDQPLDPARTLFVAGEPPHVKQYRADFLAQFGSVITSDRGTPHPQRIYTQQGLPWHVGMRVGQAGTYGEALRYADFMRGVPEKSKLCSVICSNKAFTPEHRQRLAFVQQLKERLGDRVDVFGRGFNDMADKDEALAAYRYHIALENCAHHDYWTEKLADPFLRGCYPIYWGAPNIEDYFPAESMTRIDLARPDEAIACIAALLDSETDREAAPALAGARRRVLEEHNLFALLERLTGELEKTTRPGLLRRRFRSERELAEEEAERAIPKPPSLGERVTGRIRRSLKRAA